MATKGGRVLEPCFTTGRQLNTTPLWKRTKESVRAVNAGGTNLQVNSTGLLASTSRRHKGIESVVVPSVGKNTDLLDEHNGPQISAVEVDFAHRSLVLSRVVLCFLAKEQQWIAAHKTGTSSTFPTRIPVLENTRRAERPLPWRTNTLVCGTLTLRNQETARSSVLTNVTFHFHFWILSFSTGQGVGKECHLQKIISAPTPWAGHPVHIYFVNLCQCIGSRACVHTNDEWSPFLHQPHLFSVCAPTCTAVRPTAHLNACMNSSADGGAW